jgi:RNA polymerase sigma factor, sigma-70 family
VDDHELIAKYKETEDQQYLSDLFKPYMTLVYGSCLKYFKNVHEAEDAVMDVYERLVSKVLTSDIRYFKSWLYMVTRNHCLEKLRKESTHAAKISEAELMHYQDQFHPDNVDKEKEAVFVTQCIENLNENQKECINLFYFKKMSYLDISQKIDISVGSVRSRIQNGRRNIKICMERKNLDNDMS